MKLKGKVAIITGGTKGIGKETALTFAGEGCNVVICGRDQETGLKALDEIKKINPEAMFQQINVADRNMVQAMVDKVLLKFKRIDILINNAGITRDGMLKKITEEEWDIVVDINLKGVFNCAQAVVETMKSQKYGRIINTSSVVGLYGNVGQTNYSATKAGVIGMTRSWAKEMGRYNITVNAVAPGFIVTEMTSKVPEKILDLMKEKTPLGRLGQPTDIAKAYLYLASEDASYVNGAVLSVDGGLVI